MNRKHCGGTKTILKEDIMEISKIFAENSPEQIQYAVRNGLAPKLWNIGDTIQVHLKGKIESLKLDTLHTATIIGFNHNATIEGTNTLHLCFQALIDKEYLISGKPNIFSHHNIATNKGGWDYSNIRRNILPQFEECLPQSWQDIITPCAKGTDNIGFKVDLPKCISTTYDKIWLLSEYEVFGRNKYSNATEVRCQRQYEYFKKKENRVLMVGNKAVFWWLRSPIASSTNGFCGVFIDGSAGGDVANLSLGLVPCIQIS